MYKKQLFYLKIIFIYNLLPNLIKNTKTFDQLIFLYIY